MIERLIRMFGVRRGLVRLETRLVELVVGYLIEVGEKARDGRKGASDIK